MSASLPPNIRISERYWRTRLRVANGLRDIRDRWLHGYCCAAPLTIEDGGYHFWRCSRRRGHKGPHRTANYLWGHEGGGYSPIPVGQPMPPVLDRHATLTRAQKKVRDQDRRRREAPRGAPMTLSHDTNGGQPVDQSTWACVSCAGTGTFHRRSGDEPCSECDGQGRMRYCKTCSNPIPTDLIWCWLCFERGRAG